MNKVHEASSFNQVKQGWLVTVMSDHATHLTNLINNLQILISMQLIFLNNPPINIDACNDEFDVDVDNQPSLISLLGAIQQMEGVEIVSFRQKRNPYRKKPLTDK